MVFVQHSAQQHQQSTGGATLPISTAALVKTASISTLSKSCDCKNSPPTLEIIFEPGSAPIPRRPKQSTTHTQYRADGSPTQRHIYILEPYDKNDKRHGLVIGAIMAQCGVNPDDITLYECDIKGANIPDDPDTAQKVIALNLTLAMQGYTQGLYDIANKHQQHQTTGAINLSSRVGLTLGYILLDLCLEGKNDKGQYTHPRLRQAVYGKHPFLSARQKAKCIKNFLKSTLQQSPQLQAARQRYYQAAKHLNDQGVHIVVSTGNDGLIPNMTPEDTENWLAPDGVTTEVGSINQYGKVSNYSSPNHPDLVAQGENLAIDPRFDIVDEKQDGILSPGGTSFAAPQVVAALYHCDSVTNLPPEKERDFLRRAAYNTPAPDIVEGAGIIDPFSRLEAVS